MKLPRSLRTLAFERAADALWVELYGPDPLAPEWSGHAWRARMFAAGWKRHTIRSLARFRAAALASTIVLASCGGGNAATRTAYGTEVAHCIAEEQRVLARQGTTEAEDRAALRAERARCDARLLEIESGR